MKTQNTNSNHDGWSRREFISTTAKGIAGASLLGTLLPSTAEAAHGSRFGLFSTFSSKGGAVASVSGQASDVGVKILNAGGNAIDAAVATVFALGVTRPDFCGIGGSGHLVYAGHSGQAAALDFRETAPAQVQADTFDGKGMHRDGEGSGHRVVGVPGLVAGMKAAVDRYGSGKFSLAQLIEPAWKLAAVDGVRITFGLAASATFDQTRLTYYPDTARIYGRIIPLYPTGLPWMQPDYAYALRRLMDYDAADFYTGYLAKLLTDDMAAAENNAKTNPVLLANSANWDSDPAVQPYGAHDVGLMRPYDLAAYQAKWREPLIINYRDHQIISMPPPGSGMVVLEILNLLEGFPIGSNNLDRAQYLKDSWAQSSANHLHVLAEAQKLAWADRDFFLADPDQVTVPAAYFTSKQYAQQQRAEIDLSQANSYSNGEIQRGKGHTNHVSVLDRDGNAVAVTTSMGDAFGSVVTVPQAGFLLNNEMTDFNFKGKNTCATVNNKPSTANDPSGGKRPRSNQSPTIVLRQGRPVLVVGALGGPTVPMGIVQAIVNVVNFGRHIDEALDDERIDAVAWPEACGGLLGIEDGKPLLEPRIPQAVQDELGKRGHQIYKGGEYFYQPIVTAVGANLITGMNDAAVDPRNSSMETKGGGNEEGGAAGQSA